MNPISRRLQQLQEFNALANIGEIARRYFAMNAFDGVLTMIGVLMGSYQAGVRAAGVVITTGLSTCIAMGISGLWGAYLTETAERQRELDTLECYTLTDLSRTKIGRASRVAAAVVAVVDGLAPFLAALVVLTPFFLSGLLPDVTLAYYVALGLALITLFALGAFLGTVAKANLIIGGLKMIAAGGVAILMSYVLEGF